MKQGYRIKWLLIIPGVILTAANGLSQDPIRKEVRVVKPYEPSLSNASKITLLPDLVDTARYTPDFNYTISPRSFTPEYELRPISPAKMLGEPLPKLYNSLLKLGFGSYWTPLAELSINSLRSKKYSVGAYGKHISSQGKVLLDNEQKVFGGYANSAVDLYGKKFFRNAILSGNAGLTSDQVYYYGYNTAEIPDTTLDKKEIKQSFLHLTGAVGMRSAHVDSSRFSYDLNFRYGHFRDKYDMAENDFILDTRFSKLVKKLYLGGDLGIHYIDKSEGIDSSFNALLKVVPWFTRRSEQWRLKAGLDFSFDMTDGNTTPHIYPQAELQFRVVENLLITYIGVNGWLELNNYRKITLENPFVIPGLHVKNTDHKMNIYGGFLGNISAGTSYKINASYALVDDMCFFVNDTTTVLGNRFNAEYDDVELKSVYAEIATRPVNRLTIVLKGNYYGYTMAGQERPWHKPAYDASFAARYNLRNKIILHADLFVEGKRYAKEYGIAGTVKEIELDGLADLNIGAEYRYTKLLSVFLEFYNVTSARYSQWNQYPSQRFFVLFGFTYAL